MCGLKVGKETIRETLRIDGFVFLATRIPDGLTAEDRMMAVLEFYLTSFHAGRKVGFVIKYISCT